MKAVAYANGKVLKTYLEAFELQAFEAILDKSAKEGESYCDIPILHPKNILNITYDVIIVFSTKFFEEIKAELMMLYNICEEKIIRYDDAIGRFWSERISAESKMIQAEVMPSSEICIYVIAHKPFLFESTGIYKKITVGNYCDDFSLSDKTGDNIAELNAKINECTAIYWIWKNKKTDFIGCNHYRRCFYEDSAERIYRATEDIEIFKDKNILEKEMAMALLSKYDILLPKAYYVKGHLLEQICRTSDEVLAREVYGKLLFLMEKIHPEDVDALKQVMNGYMMYPCNMFVTSWEVFSEYCEWLFSFLIPLAEQVDVSGCDAYSGRIVGFFAERMLTVWLWKKRLKICELNYTEIV